MPINITYAIDRLYTGREIRHNSNIECACKHDTSNEGLKD